MRESRLKEFKHYGAHYPKEVLENMPDPQAEETFTSAKLNRNECFRPRHESVLNLYRECLQLRARAHIFQNPSRDLWSVQPVTDQVLALRWRDPDGDWLLLIGVTPGEQSIPLEEPFIRSKPGRRWNLQIASNDPCFGNCPSQTFWSEDTHAFHLSLPGAVLLREAS